MEGKTGRHARIQLDVVGLGCGFLFFLQKKNWVWVFEGAFNSNGQECSYLIWQTWGIFGSIKVESWLSNKSGKVARLEGGNDRRPLYINMYVCVYVYLYVENDCQCNVVCFVNLLKMCFSAGNTGNIRRIYRNTLYIFFSGQSPCKILIEYSWRYSHMIFFVEYCLKV